MENNTVYSKAVSEACKTNMKKLKSSRIRNHKIINSAKDHSGDILNEEKKNYMEFLPSYNFYKIMELTGRA